MYTMGASHPLQTVDNDDITRQVVGANRWASVQDYKHGWHDIKFYEQVPLRDDGKSEIF